MPTHHVASGRTTCSPAVVTWLLLMRSFALVDREAEHQLRTLGLTHPQFGVLARLRANDGPSQHELGDMLLLDKGNLCSILRRLEENKPWWRSLRIVRTVAASGCISLIVAAGS